jgi:hypothetical protein
MVKANWMRDRRRGSSSSILAVSAWQFERDATQSFTAEGSPASRENLAVRGRIMMTSFAGNCGPRS